MSGIGWVFSRLLSAPAAEDTRARLTIARESLPERHRTPNQFLGAQYAGCGATIGLMPRCDFACRGCYLGTEANRIASAPLAEIKCQLRQIRAWLGHGGNVQITDGEATLRPADELVELIRFAREIGLVPMLMSHGDGLRQRPEMLNRLIREGGLSEISIHIDTTQRGRLGQAYKRAASERELMPLRDEFAELIRRARRDTGRRLEAATTVTITRNNLSQVPDIMRWLSRNADAFKMISFHPLAQVGRTEQGLGGPVSVESLWRAIAQGLGGKHNDYDTLMQHKGLFGHPDCTRFVQGLVVSRPHRVPEFVALFRGDDDRDRAFKEQFFDRFGGISFRLDNHRIEAGVRLFTMLVRQPRLMAIELPAFVSRKAAETGGGWLKFVWSWLRGTHPAHYLNIVSHHFMDAAELATPLGRERLDSCVFKVPIRGELVSMCAVNALGYRERYYESLQSEDTKSFENERTNRHQEISFIAASGRAAIHRSVDAV